MPPPADGSSIVARFSGRAVVDFALTSTEWAGPFGFVTFRLTDTNFEPAAENMAVVRSPRLEGATDAEATGRTNVFAGELIEHAGTPPSPDTFVVNCPVPVLAEVEFEV